MGRVIEQKRFGAILDVQQADVALALCGRAEMNDKDEVRWRDGKGADTQSDNSERATKSDIGTN